QNLKTHKAQVLDARSRGRFVGTEPEPRAGLRGGHIPGSLNLPYDALYQKDGTFLPADAIREKLEGAGIDLRKPVITSCGSGVTASVLALGFHVVGRPDVAVYDGSWSEGGGRDDTPVEKEAARRFRHAAQALRRRQGPRARRELRSPRDLDGRRIAPGRGGLGRSRRRSDSRKHRRGIAEGQEQPARCAGRPLDRRDGQSV